MAQEGKKTVMLDASRAPRPAADDCMDLKTGVKRAPPVEVDSPSKQRAGQVAVDIDTLRALLAEQSASLLDKVMVGQQRQMEQLTGQLRTEIKTSETANREELQAQAGDIKSVKKEQADLSLRLQKLEAQGPTGSIASASTAVMDASNSDRHRFTLVFGGWPKDSSRKTITDQAHKALQEVGVSSLTDYPTFCTGPRRSMCLLQFRVRSPAEDFAGMRDRMGKVMTTVNQHNVILRGGKKMWCGYSKPKHERDQGSSRCPPPAYR